jgi:hypothetical protein
MKCYKCNNELIWGGDHDFEAYGLSGKGIVSNLSCSDCPIYVEVYYNIDEDNKKGEIK